MQDNSNQGTEPLQLNKNDLESKIIEMLKSCYDPEIPVDIYQLGLIYKIQTDPEGKVNIEMTLTSPQCPVAGSLPPEVERKIKTIEGVSEVKVEVVWDPPWEPSKMTDAAKLQLGML
ncbi:MAG: SUF system Fe-S cluster assembly protein [Elusimicrobia bacterium RIFCSPLOWO2_02_FULL_39_32]|nr:MAG: SUF system Fe-S cluster assembly protein [Elusimicrobia bacterium RIFCSPHIGHO2_02_FULL_39_36]OGR91425.1 MAG: SUF system Fe-S cluster assembly protein [Elusimicrobia bacterium RIFCSPLOWO2_02_FULL_39_32]OGR98540.1 MAG: SUF system Fe-S cluster assembly protein [Elusimicrobia bacterium RIFCSPLOWO2_12_FULL_39_28]